MADPTSSASPARPYAPSAMAAASRAVQAGGGADDLAGQQFRAFYGELLRLRDTALQCSESDALSVSQSIAKGLIRVIELHTIEARRLAGRSVMDVESEARYLKAALADEVFLNLEWPGRTHWRHVLIEAQLFNSSVAGERVFDTIESLLRAREPSSRAVAALHLNVLALGFQGRLRGSAQPERLTQYRRELFEFIAQRDAFGAAGRSGPSEQAYAHTAGHLAKRRIPRLSRWTVGLLLTAILMLGLSELLWLWRSWPLRDLLNHAVSASVPLTQPKT